MKAPLTFEEALDLVRSRVERAWLEEVLADPDGRALVHIMADIAVALDAKDAADASSLFVVPSSGQVAPPASGPERATTTLAVSLRKQFKSSAPLLMPAGTRVQTPDGHTYTLDLALSFKVGEVGVAKSVAATALLPGHPGVIPAGEITEFSPVANGISGIGTKIELVTISGSTKALRFKTDTAIPHPFKSEMIGMLLEVVSVEDVTKAGDVGRVVGLVGMNPGGAAPGDPASPENAYAWTLPVNTTTDSRYSVWATGTFGYEWRIADWSEYFDVTNTSAVVGGRDDVLGELAVASGRPRQAGEEDEQIRARLSMAPVAPSPLGLLRKAITTLVPFGFGRLDVRVYEMSEPGPWSLDPYAYNFPAAMGFIGEMTCTDTATPDTPDGVASQSPVYATLSPFFNPGLSLIEPGTARWVVVVRWDAPAGMSSDRVATIRRLLFAACKAAKQPGLIVQLYYLPEWSFP